MRSLWEHRDRSDLYRNWIVLGLFIAVCLVAFGVVVGNELFTGHKSKDYPLWHRTGLAFWSPESIYAERRGEMLDFLYSPFAAMIIAPFAVLGKVPLYTVCVGAILAAWAWCVRQGVEIATPGKTTLTVVVLPSLIVLPLFYNNFDLGQPNMILLGLILAALRWDFKGRSIPAGLALGAAAAFKLFPLAVLPYWIVRRRFKAALIAGISALAFLFLAPAPFRGFETNLEDLSIWYPAISHIDELTLAQRQSGWGYKNQSLYVMTHRLVRPVPTGTTPPSEPAHMNVLNLDFETANRVYLGVAFLVGLGFLVLLRRASFDHPYQRAREWAILVALITLATPLARNYYFAALLIPITVLLQGIVEQQGSAVARRSTTLLVCGIVLMILSVGGLPRILQAYGNMLWATVLIVSGLVDQLLNGGSNDRSSGPQRSAPPLSQDGPGAAAP